MITEQEEAFERDIRAMRDSIYGTPTSDKNWEGCKKNWMREESVIWLKRMTGKK